MMVRTTLLASAAVVLSVLRLASAHDDHGAHPAYHHVEVPPNADWATRHMAEEHHIAGFDAASFFHLHDYHGRNEWSAKDIARTYGLYHKSNSHVAQSTIDASVQKVLDLFDKDGSGTISLDEYTVVSARGIKLPDLGFGPGHHGDDEYEYEQHHFLKYHGADTKEEDLTHPEDIEHFRYHEQLELAQEKQEEEDRLKIVPRNIPQKFRRYSF